MGFYALLLSIILFLLFISYKYPNTEKVVSLMLFVIFVLIGGLRDNVGCDYASYVKWYVEGSRDNNFEFGFLVIMKAFRYLNLDYKFLFFFFSFFTYLFVYMGIRKYNKKSCLPLVFYFLVPVLFLCSFSYIRQCLSVSIAFYAFTFLLDRKYILYFLWMAVGISFHYSCLVPFIIFFLVYICGDLIKTHHLYVSMGVAFIISRIGIVYWASIFLKDSHYLYYVSSRAVPVILLKLLVINAMGVVVIKYFDKRGFQYVYQRYLLLLYICSIIFLNIFSESSDLTRIYIYFRIFEIILIADIMRNVMYNYNKRILLIGFICCFYLLPFFRVIKNNSEDEGMIKNDFKLVPYKSLFLKEYV